MSDLFELTVTKVIPASRKDVFEAWLDPEALARFMKPMPDMPDCKSEVDPREGGSFSLLMMAGDQEIPHRGEYKTISKYDKLVFTWLASHSHPDSIVTLVFKERGPRETELILHHTPFSTEERRDSHESGWGRIVDALAGILS